MNKYSSCEAYVLGEIQELNDKYESLTRLHTTTQSRLEELDRIVEFVLKDAHVKKNDYVSISRCVLKQYEDDLYTLIVDEMKRRGIEGVTDSHEVVNG